MINIENILKYTQDLTLLYVEDNKDTRESTLLILNDLFNNIIIAVNGEDGLNKFKNNDIDLIITDINMPILDGLSMCKAIRQIDNNQSIIVLTAITEIETLKEAIDIGVNTFINKPLQDINILFNKIHYISKNIHNEKNQKNLQEIKQDKEKIQLIFRFIKHISHHWRQPLSVISIISSNFKCKIDNNLKITDEDINNMDLITKKTKELSSMLNKLETLDYDNLLIEDIENIIQISNPIYRDKK